MQTFFRNPDVYTEEIQLSGISHFSWDLGHVERKRIDVIKWANIFLKNTPHWKMLVVAMEGTAEYSSSSTSINKPDAVYPSWQFEDGYELLEDYCRNPVGKDLIAIYANDVEPRFQPVRNQPHRVLIYDPPDTRSHVGSSYLRNLIRIKRINPNVEFIIHNTGSFRLMFGSGFEYAIFDPCMSAKSGSLIAPSGEYIKYKEFYAKRNWIHLLGFVLDDVREELTSRILYNIESIFWAEQNFNKNLEFSLVATSGLDIDTVKGKYEYENLHESWLTQVTGGARIRMGPEDGIVCDKCALSPKCKFYREGSVCSVAGTGSADLSKMFGTRDASVIIDGLLELTNIQAGRVKKDLAQEDITGERVLETDKRLKDLFDAGVKVAKLIDPKLSGAGTTVNLGMIGGTAIIAQQTPQELMASAVRALEGSGFSRDQITPGMIQGILEGVANRGAVREIAELEARTIEHKSLDDD